MVRLGNGPPAEARWQGADVTASGFSRMAGAAFSCAAYARGSGRVHGGLAR